jgi:hypothetical protein
MSGKMPKMMSTQREVSALTDQLLKSFEGIETEKESGSPPDQTYTARRIAQEFEGQD